MPYMAAEWSSLAEGMAATLGCSTLAAARCAAARCGGPCDPTWFPTLAGRYRTRTRLCAFFFQCTLRYPSSDASWVGSGRGALIPFAHSYAPRSSNLQRRRTRGHFSMICSLAVVLAARFLLICPLAQIYTAARAPARSCSIAAGQLGRPGSFLHGNTCQMIR